MDELLLQIVNEAQNAKYQNLKEAAQDAYDFLDKQQGLIRDPPHELRAKFLRAIQLAFETKRNKLIAFALSGLHKMLRDDRFQSQYEPEDDSLWLPAQMLHAMGSILSQSDDTQTAMLKVLLQVSCCRYWTMNGRLIITILTTCYEAFEYGNQAVKTAAQAAISQTLRSFCLFLDEECYEMDENSKRNKSIHERGVACFNETLPIFQYICCKLDEAQNVRNSSTVVFLLESLLTLTSSMPQKINTSFHFTTFLWQKFCPALIAFLGTPRVDKYFTSREGKDSEIGRGSGYLTSSLGFNSHQAKTIYSIGIELVRLVGCVGALRPVLESVFHRMLLYPPPQQRLESLKALKELLQNPSRIIDFAGPLLILEDKSNQLQSDMALMRLAMDSIEESINASLPLLQASVSCVVAMLSSLQELCDGNIMNCNYTYTINSLYDDLESCDYRGPLTYQSMARLPKTYREQLELMKKNVSNSNLSGYRLSKSEESINTNSPKSEIIEDLMEEVNNCYEDTEYDLVNEHERIRLEKLPKHLHVGRQCIEEYNIDVQRHNARKFVKMLRQDVIPSVFNLRSNIEVDEALQNFASNYCQGVFAAQQMVEGQIKSNAKNCALITIMNADGIYLATYAALLLNLKLIRINYYVNPSCQIPINEEQFVEEVHGAGVLVYLSATWLSELYQQILACNLMEKCGYNPFSNDNNALINVLIDIDGITGSYTGGQVLSDYLRLEKAQLSRNELTPEAKAGAKLSRRIITCCWDSMITVLSMGLNPNQDDTTKGIIKNDCKNVVKDTIVLALEGLHRAATLSNILGLQYRCGAIFALLAKTACSEQLISKLRRTKDVLRLKLQNKATNIHTSHALSMEILLGRSLELGSHGTDCWPHVFTCCLYVSKLEHDFFGKNQNIVFLKPAKKEKKEFNNQKINCKSIQDKLHLSFNIVDDGDTCVDVYGFLSTSYTQTTISESIPEIIQESNADSLFDGFLPAEYAAKIVCALSQQVDRLFENAALKLNLRALCSFLRALCQASKDQLFKSNDDTTGNNKIWWRRNKPHDEELNLLLSRLGQVILKCVKSGRPLIHIMRVWSILGPHFMEAACHKDHGISKKAVQCIHDTIAVLLNDQRELSHFHFNEALFKPFENILCLELCDNDVQDQIISCICEFVETNRREIRSGWRPLFGALKVASIGNAECVESAPLLEVFRIFLTTDNTLVFANAALDCILCLLKHVRGISDPEIFQKELKNDTEQCNDTEDRRMKLCLESLKYLLSCSNILTSMYQMPTCPIFHSARRISMSSIPQYVDPVIPNLETAFFDYKMEPLNNILPNVSTSQDSKFTNLQSIDQPSGILRVWYLLIEGLASAMMICPKKYQPHTLEMLFHLLRNTLNTPGPFFGLYCINHLLLPMVQNWLRKISKIYRGWDDFAVSFKQCCGLTTDLIVDFIDNLQGPTVKKNENLLSVTTLMLKQFFMVMAECIVQPIESIARLGCACIRHVLISSGPNLTSEQWDVCGVACHRACFNSLQELHQLTMAFSPCSESFYGDIAKIKVAVRRDATPEETERLHQLATQVFLLEDQQNDNVSQSSDEKSYVFLLHSPLIASTLKHKFYFIRIQMRTLVIGLLVHQMLLQCIANVLLQGSETSMPRHTNVFMSPMISSTKHSIFTFLTHLEPQHLDNFLSALDLSYIAAIKFDSRPGLKFLLQKVANLRRPANLYRQARTAWTVKIFSLFELCLYEVSKNNVDLELVTDLLNGVIHIIPKYKKLLKYLNLLQTTFEELCNTYVDITLDKDGRYTKVDMIAAENYYFILSQPDVYAEIMKDPLNQKFPNEITKNDYQVDKNSINFGKSALKVEMNILGEEEEDYHRSFYLSNLATEYSIDSGSSSAPDTYNSRSISRLGFSNSQVVYIDHSRGIPIEDLMNPFNELCIHTPKIFGQEKKVFRYKTVIRNSKSYILDNNQLSNKSNKTFKAIGYSKLNKWKSDDCLLYKRCKLNFMKKNDIDTFMKRKNFCFRSKSMVELRRSKEIYIMRHNFITMYSELLKYKKNYVQNKMSLKKHSLKRVKILLEEFEKSTRGYHTNPFIEDEKQILMTNRCFNSIDDAKQPNCQDNRDSEIHRKVWADMVGATLEFVLTLTDEQLAPLLPVLFNGVKILIQNAFESILRQRLSTLFQRITSIYGLTVAATNSDTGDDRQ